MGFRNMQEKVEHSFFYMKNRFNLFENDKKKIIR